MSNEDERFATGKQQPTSPRVCPACGTFGTEYNPATEVFTCPDESCGVHHFHRGEMTVDQPTPVNYVRGSDGRTDQREDADAE